MNIVKKITSTLTKKDIELIIEKHFENQGYDVVLTSFDISKKVNHDYFAGHYETLSLNGATSILKERKEERK